MFAQSLHSYAFWTTGGGFEKSSMSNHRSEPWACKPSRFCVYVVFCLHTCLVSAEPEDSIGYLGTGIMDG